MKRSNIRKGRYIMSNIQITGIKIEVTDSIREHTNAHFSKLEKHFDTIISQSLTFSKDGHLFNAHAEIKTSNGSFSATAKSENFNAMVKDVADKLHRQLNKAKPNRSKTPLKALSDEPSDNALDEFEDLAEEYAEA